MLHVVAREDAGLEGVEGGPLEPSVLALLDDDVEFTFVKPQLIRLDWLVIVEGAIHLKNFQIDMIKWGLLPTPI